MTKLSVIQLLTSNETHFQPPLNLTFINYLKKYLTENRLSEAQGRIKVLEKNLENQHKQSRTEHKFQPEEPSPRRDDHILSMSISTLQNLLLEKDTTLSRYQELLKSERNHNMRTFDGLSGEIKELKKVIDGLENTIAEKEKLVEKLKKEIVELKEAR